MPTYSYVCKDCEHAFEIQQSFSDAALTTCPKCSGELRKQFGNLGVSFKGSGFYRTDPQSGSSSSSD
jgi:putative FmdB family regulatory protein